jgi:hypothetical protein
LDSKQSSSGFDRSSSFATDHFNERSSQSHLLVEKVEASHDRGWFAVQMMASLPCIYWGDFNEYQDSYADIVQMLRCTGIGRTSLIRATDPLVTQATMVVQSDDKIPWYHIDLAFCICFPVRRREH